MSFPKINVKLLSTTILVIFGVYGQGKCQSVTFYAYNMLKKMGLKNVKIVAGSAIVPSDARILVFGSRNEMAELNSVYSSNAYENKSYFSEDGWHCWIQCDDLIFDVNLEVTTKNPKPVSEIKFPVKQCYYTRQPVIENHILETNSLGSVSDKKLEEAIQFYEKLKNKSAKIMIEEGEVSINNQGKITALILHAENKNIKPWKL